MAGAGRTAHGPQPGDEGSGGKLERLRLHLQARGHGPRTIKSYLYGARAFLSTYGDPLEGLKEKDVEEYTDGLVAAGYSASTVRMAVAGVKALLAAHGVDTLRGYPLPRRPVRLPVFLTEEETRRLLQAARRSERDYAIIRTLVYSGLRVSELCALRVADLNQPAGTLSVRSGKGARDRIAVIDPETASVVAERVRVACGGRPPEGEARIFPLGAVSVERIVRQRAKDARIEKRVTPHTLRHTMATGLLENGCDIRFIQKQLGHASLATTEIYTHVDTRSLRAAYLEHLPRFSAGGSPK